LDCPRSHSAQGSVCRRSGATTSTSREFGRKDATVLTTAPARRPLILSVVACLVTVVVGAATGQTGFKVTHQVAKTTTNKNEVHGSVASESRAEAVDVSVTVEALGANGKPVARGISYVATSLKPGTSADFVAKVPAVPGATTYRATVSSYRFIQGMGGGGG